MKLVYIAANLPFAGGGDDFFIPEVMGMLKEGHEVRIVPRIPTAAPIDTDAKKLLQFTWAQPLVSATIMSGFILELLTGPVRVLKALAMMRASGNLMNLLKNLAVFPKGVWVGRNARKWGAVHIHSQWAAATTSMALFASEISGIPFSFTAHRSDIVLANMLGLKFERSTFFRFISKSGIAIAQRRGFNPPANKLNVIHMGVEFPENVSAKKKHGIPNVLCPANMTPVKGHNYLLEALSHLGARGVECTLLLAGKGFDVSPAGDDPTASGTVEVTADENFAPTASAILHQVISLGLGPRVRFLGQLSHETLLNLYKSGDVDCVVLPSLDLGNDLHEGIPVSLMEAMAHGVPVISTRTGGIPELLDGGAGVMVPPADARALADALEGVLRDPGAAVSLSTAGRDRIKSDFRADQVAAEMIRLMGSGRTGNIT